MHSRLSQSWAKEPSFYEAPWPEGGKLTPLPYQHAGVEYRIQRKHGLFGDAPGLGKTAECILTSNAIEAKRTLVICPASLRLNWEREIWLWSTIENVSTYPILSAKDGVSLSHDYVIASYDALSNINIYHAMMEGFWDHLILDEAHYLKDPGGNIRTTRTVGGNKYNKAEKRFTYFEGIVSRSGYITGATGTPMPNQPIEIYNMARLMDWEAIERMSLESFRDYYYAEGYGFKMGWYMTAGEVMKYGRHKGTVRNKPRHLKELQKRLRSSFMVRRLKEDVMTQLPPKQYHLMPIQTYVRYPTSYETFRLEKGRAVVGA